MVKDGLAYKGGTCLCFLLLITFSALLGWEIDKKDHWLVSTGVVSEVIKADPKCGSNNPTFSATLYLEAFNYTTVEGVDMIGYGICTKNPLEVGAEVTIIYNPKKPEQVELEGQLNGPIVAFGVMIGISFCFCLVCSIVSFRYEKEEIAEEEEEEDTA